MTKTQAEDLIIAARAHGIEAFIMPPPPMAARDTYGFHVKLSCDQWTDSYTQASASLDRMVRHDA